MPAMIAAVFKDFPGKSGENDLSIGTASAMTTRRSATG